MTTETKPHIAMLIGALTKGGAERVLVNLAEELTDRGWQVTMVTQYKKEKEYPLDPKIRRVISDITEEETGKSRISNFLKRYKKLQNIWKAEKPDVILSFIGKNNIMAILTGKRLSIPVAVAVRGDPKEEYYNFYLRYLARHLFYRADGLILQTSASRSFFPKKLQEKAVILKNPIHGSFFQVPFDGEREKRIVAVGRIDANKNHELLIRAFAKIAEEFPEHQLVIYGEGELREELTELVRSGRLEEEYQLSQTANLSSRISLPGSIDQVADEIRKSSIFVLPSNTEGAPNTLIEAMLMGLAVISTDCPCGGPADLIQNGKNGILTGVGDLEELTMHLKDLLSHPQKAEALGREAYKLQSVFETGNVYNSWENFLRSLTGWDS